MAEESQLPELEFQFPTAETIQREIAVIVRFLVITRKRLTAILQDLDSDASADTKLVVDAIERLQDIRSSNSFEKVANSVFEGKTLRDMTDLAKEFRYAFHMLGALKGLLELKESFSLPVQSSHQGYRVIESLSRKGEWVGCWLMLKGCKNPDRRLCIAKSFYVPLTLCLIEVRRGGLMLTKSQESEGKTRNEEASHLCHQAICVKPGHLIAESQQANFRRMNCQGLETCGHTPQCLLPHRDTRKQQYKWVGDILSDHIAQSPHASRFRSSEDVPTWVSRKSRKLLIGKKTASSE